MIQILLATYNGEKYIRTQLESVFAQSYTEFEILVSDDGSTDRTIEIIEEFREKYPGKIRFIPDKTPSGGAKNNFFKLMGYADSDYIMFCDQDDYWLADKIECTLNKMKETETDGTPALVHTDLSVTDKDLNITHNSYFKMQQLTPSDNINRAVVQNVVTGCTVMINRALLDIVKNGNGEDVIMHDWWLYIAATCFGTVNVIKKPTILYRQHENNSVGARTLKFRKITELKNALNKTYKQAEHFVNVFGNVMPVKALNCLKEYAGMSEYSKIKKIRTILKFRFYKQSLIRVIIQAIVC